ncbi:MAG: hypothetical protein R2795_10745 [Saprospiraceae bacterium]
MQLSTRYPHLLSAVFSACGLLLMVVQWQFYILTGSALILSQAILLLTVTVSLLVIGFTTDEKWQLVVQFFNSFVVLLLCGLSISESYIRWQEGVAPFTAAALPVVVLGFGGLVLLSRLLVNAAGNHYSQLEYRLTGLLLPALSGLMTVVLMIAHWTGWYWLDSLVASVIAFLIAIGALFFLLDGYWRLDEMKV